MTRWKERKHTKKYVEEYITPLEAEEIIKACERPRDKLILRTMWETAGRVSEVLNLTPEGIDKLNNCIYLTNLKQGRPDLKKVFLFPESTLCTDLLEYCKDNNIHATDWIFQGGVTVERLNKHIGQVSPTYIWYLISNPDSGRRMGLATALGVRKIKDGKRKSAWPHLFRHGAAMNIYRRTGRLDVTQKELGHSDIKTTEIYAKLMDSDVKNIIDKSTL